MAVFKMGVTFLIILMLGAGETNMDAMILSRRLSRSLWDYFTVAYHVSFKLYTKDTPDSFTTLLPHNDDLGHLNVKHPTRIIVHGWMSSAEDMASIKDAYLSLHDYNVIMVDWKSAAKLLYVFNSAFIVKRVGEHLASLIDFLASKGVNLSQIHIVGHSLGAHIAGVAGNRTRSGSLGKITGLDPARPLYQTTALENRLDKKDAVFVEVIHTSGGNLGYLEPLGHADFFPNNGTTRQPGCGELEDFFGACSHSRAHEYFAESIVSKVGFIGHQCSSWDKYEEGECFNNPHALMGEYTDPRASGNYFLETSDEPPFALGFEVIDSSHLMKENYNLLKNELI